MASTYTHQTENVRKTWFLMTGFFLFIILVGFMFSQYFKSPVFLYGAVAVSFVSNFISYWFSAKIALSSAGATPIEKKDYPELWNVVENLSITAGLPMPKLYIINDPAPNAFATGRNKDNAAVAVTSGLLPLLTKTELEGVLAHELSHIGNRDILLQSVVVVMAGAVALVSDMLLRVSSFGGGSDSDNKPNPLTLVFIIAASFLAPIAASMIKLAISRKREFLADSSGALLTRYPEGLASALQKISEYPQGLKNATNATAHLYISNPFGEKKEGDKVSWFQKLYMTHPPVEERIAALLNK
jgi:heat shock protein HtpX